MKIAIIGTGAAALAVADAIAGMFGRAEIWFFDAGPQVRSTPDKTNPDWNGHEAWYDGIYRELKANAGIALPQVKSRFGARLPRVEAGGKSRFFTNNIFGGQTMFWGGTMVPFHDHDLRGWPVTLADLAPHYRHIAGLVGIAGERDALTPLFPEEYANRPPMKKLAGLTRIEAALNTHGQCGTYHITAGVNRVALETRQGTQNACVKCGECMAGCFAGSVFGAAGSVLRLMAQVNARHVAMNVRSVDLSRRTIQAEAQGRVERIEGFDKIFLCAGCTGTAEILLRSAWPKEVATLQDNAIFQFPILSLGWGVGDANPETYVALANVVAALTARNPAMPTLHAQLYPNFDYLWRCAMPEFLWPVARRAVRATRDRIAWARLYTHGSDGHHYSMFLNSRGDVEYAKMREPKQEAAAAAIADLTRALGAAGLVVPPLPAQVSATSTHFAGTFPYSGGARAVARDGSVAPGVHLCDAACFPDSPAASPTFTIMANARRTAIEALS